MIRSYVICNVVELPQVDFSQILEEDVNTLRKSVDGTKALLKYEGTVMPQTIVDLASKQGPYSHAEIGEILSTHEWVPDIHKKTQ